MVEIDMGTLTHTQFRRKLRAFQAYLATGLYHRDWRRDRCSYLVLTTSQQRRNNLWKTARQEVPGAFWPSYWVATTAVLTPSEFAESDAWLTLDGQYVALR